MNGDLNYEFLHEVRKLANRWCAYPRDVQDWMEHAEIKKADAIFTMHPALVPAGSANRALESFWQFTNQRRNEMHMRQRQAASAAQTHDMGS